MIVGAPQRAFPDQRPNREESTDDRREHNNDRPGCVSAVIGIIEAVTRACDPPARAADHARSIVVGEQRGPPRIELLAHSHFAGHIQRAHALARQASASGGSTRSPHDAGSLRKNSQACKELVPHRASVVLRDRSRHAPERDERQGEEGRERKQERAELEERKHLRGAVSEIPRSREVVMRDTRRGLRNHLDAFASAPYSLRKINVIPRRRERGV